MGSAMNDSAQLLVASQQGTEFKKQALSPGTMNHTNTHKHPAHKKTAPDFNPVPLVFLNG